MIGIAVILVAAHGTRQDVQPLADAHEQLNKVPEVHQALHQLLEGALGLVGGHERRKDPVDRIRKGGQLKVPILRVVAEKTLHQLLDRGLVLLPDMNERRKALWTGSRKGLAGSPHPSSGR
jgi:hypothetical protein